jgi:putative oxidoreductase
MRDLEVNSELGCCWRSFRPPTLRMVSAMTQRLETRLNPHAAIVLSLFRIFFGLLFLCHGTAAIFGWPVGPVAASGSLFWLGGLIALITGILITLGLLTRPAAFIASGEMAVAFFT